MSKIGIITDSHSSITQAMAQELGIMVLPMPFMINGENYLEGINLSREDFFRLQKSGSIFALSPNSTLLK